MKKRILILSVFLMFSIPSASRAGTFMLGLKGWYTSWDSAFAKTLGAYYHDYFVAAGIPNTVTINPGTGYLAGPLVGYQTDDRKWSLSFAGMIFSSFKQNTKFETSTEKAVLDLKLTRKDMDFTAGYSLSDHLKLFAGYKYMYTRADLKFKFYNGEQDMGWYQTTSNIPSFGVGTAFPLSDKLLLSGQFGLLYVKTNMEYKDGTSYKVDNSWGYTIEAALNYLLTQNVFLQAGVKYQTFTLKISDLKTNEKDNFFGFTGSAIYMF